MTWQQQINNNITHASVVNKYANGSTDLEAHLVDVHDHDGNVVGKLVPAAAVAYDAMVKAAWNEGIDIRPTSSADTFRSLAIQKRIFGQRYTTKNTGVAGRTCGGTYYHKVSANVATAACPGTSNHGKGEAVDVANCSGTRLAWLTKHAASYGFQWELSSEPWHIHYMLGDSLPVLPNQPAAPAALVPQEDDDMVTLLTTDGAILLHAGKLVFITEGSGIDSDASPMNQWDLRKAPATWTALKAAFGPIVRK